MTEAVAELPSVFQDTQRLLSTLSLNNSTFLQGNYVHDSTITQLNNAENKAQSNSNSVLALTGTQTLNEITDKITAVQQIQAYKKYHAALLAEYQINNAIAALEQRKRNKASRDQHIAKMNAIATQQQLIQHNNMLSHNKIPYNYIREQVQQDNYDTVQERRTIDCETKQHKLNRHMINKTNLLHQLNQRAATQLLERPMEINTTIELNNRVKQHRQTHQQYKESKNIAIQFSQCQNTINRQLKHNMLKQHKKLQSDVIKHKTAQLKSQLQDHKQQYEIHQVQQYKQKQYNALDLKYGIQQQLAEQNIKYQQHMNKQKQQQQYNRTIKHVVQQAVQPLQTDVQEHLDTLDIQQILHNSELLDQYIQNSLHRDTITFDNDTELLSDFDLEQQILVLKQLALQVKEQYTTGTIK